jgi:NaMN:DMB phosphoribosyltransferase
MVAVAALLAALRGPGALERVAVGTTRWVAADPAADVPGLTAEVWPALPLLAANLDFGQSRHAVLHAYERFLVKEGVGAGGACVAAVLASGCSRRALQAAIDDAYDEVLDDS